MYPGDVVFFSCLIIHGTGPNNSNKPRWSNTYAYNVTGNGKNIRDKILRQS